MFFRDLTKDVLHIDAFSVSSTNIQKTGNFSIEVDKTTITIRNEKIIYQFGQGKKPEYTYKIELFNPITITVKVFYWVCLIINIIF